ncbi:hypothetical protein HanXRQr2_Chr09g0398151 [Helianthus annuus]|uniref:Uncharacterized protein n=1 Tax=Helianthus annuus TaxID=4232 RepID=A0A9K3N9A5_HELAN|nr:hypothetical protein HanXRQr2_Chr09g0398151 [Helianthus annuus]KAJ0893979.1 hypothetical protein HanPSC8_Chr09g0383891 [Helianthus annuus]
MNGADDNGIGADFGEGGVWEEERAMSVLGLAAVVGFSGGDIGLGSMTIGDLLCLCDFLLFEVQILSTSFSFFTFFNNSCLNTSVLLSFISFLFCFASISLSVYLLRVSSIPFFLPVLDFPKDFAEVCLAGFGFCFGCFLGVGLLKFFMESFSPFSASSSSSFSNTGAGVVPVNFAMDSFMPLMSACVSLYLGSTITLISFMWELC